MTKRQKFIKVFGFNPSEIPIHSDVCDELDCDNKCPCGPRCSTFWDSEYVKPKEEIEYCPNEELRRFYF